MRDFINYISGCATCYKAVPRCTSYGALQKTSRTEANMRRLLAVLFLLLALVMAACSKTAVTPSAEFMDSKLLILSGPNEHGIDGTYTVRAFIDRVSALKKAEVNGWEKTSSGYSLSVRIVDEFELNFRWESAQNRVLLQEVRVNKGQTASGMQFLILLASLQRAE